MGKAVRWCVLMLCALYAGLALAAAAQPLSAATVVRTEAQWRALIASGQKTPLDALTPYGKHVFIDGLSGAWGEHGLRSLPTGPLVRELNREELHAVLTFLDSDAYFIMLERRLIGPPLRMPAPSAAVARDLRRLEKVLFATSSGDDASHATTTALPPAPQTYRALFGERMNEQRLRRQQAGDLLLLFDAAASTNLVHPGAPALADLLRVHAELVRRGVDTRRTLDDTVLQALVAARAFGQARTFATARPALAAQAIPAIVDAMGTAFSGRSVFDYDQASHTLTRKAFARPVDMELIMVVNAGCQPSRRALDAVRTDPALRARLQQANLTIIVPPSAAIPFPFVADWNAANPATPIRIPFNLREWASVNTGAVPMFYLLQDGRVTGSVTGWPPEGNAARLHALLDAAAAGR